MNLLPDAVSIGRFEVPMTDKDRLQFIHPITDLLFDFAKRIVLVKQVSSLGGSFEKHTQMSQLDADLKGAVKHAIGQHQMNRQAIQCLANPDRLPLLARDKFIPRNTSGTQTSNINNYGQSLHTQPASGLDYPQFCQTLLAVDGSLLRVGDPGGGKDCDDGTDCLHPARYIAGILGPDLCKHQTARRNANTSGTNNCGPAPFFHRHEPSRFWEAS